MAEYFFELLTEEIPAWMHDAAQATLLQQLTKLTLDLGEPPDDRNPVIVNSTPRRIIFFLSHIPLRESDRDEEVKGPPVKAAYDAEGKPTQALNGFLKKNNAAIDDVIAGGDYIRVRRTIKGRAAGEILQERVPQIIESLRWPKMMRWGKGEHSYIRPIHSVVSVLDGEHLPLDDLRHRLGDNDARPPHARAAADRGALVQRIRDEAGAGARGHRRRRAAAT